MLIDGKQVAAMIGCSPRHVVERLRHRPEFPSPVPAYKRPYKWRKCDIDEYCGG